MARGHAAITATVQPFVGGHCLCVTVCIPSYTLLSAVNHMTSYDTALENSIVESHD